MRPDIVGIGTQREFHFHLGGNDVRLRAAVNRADRDDRRVRRAELAADDGLETDNNARGEHDRVLRQAEAWRRGC